MRKILQRTDGDISKFIVDHMQSQHLHPNNRNQQSGSVAISPLYAERLAELKSPALVAHGRALIEAHLWDAGGYYKPIELKSPVDWSMDPFKDRTWRWFLHQFEYARGLLAYDLSEGGQNGYLLLKEFCQSWSRLYLHDLSDTDAVWHDHGTALRVRNLLLLLCYMQQAGLGKDVFAEELIDILEVHANVLLEDSFYSKGTNHGLDQNIILFELLKELAGVLQLPGAIKKACDRVNFEIAKAFAADGGHIENSSAYLTFGLKQAVDALHIGQSYDGPASLIALPPGMLERATEALLHTTRPDGKLPLIGDTCDYIVRDIFRDVKPINYKQFLYSIHKGARGVAPTSPDLVLRDSGWAIFRSSWSVRSAEQFDDQLHCVFKCGFLSNYHRHDDDLSFVLYYKGKDWVVEGGLYKHSRTDPYRLYFRSAQAHNISMPIRGKASRVLESAQNTGILSYEQSGRTSSVHAQSSMFTGYYSSRYFEYSRDRNIIRILDKIVPAAPDKVAYINQRVQDDAITYVTRFLVPDDKKVTLDRDRGVCQIEDGRDKLLLSCVSSVSDIKVTVGQTKPEIKGWISHRPNKLKHCQVIEFLHKGHSLDVSFELTWA